MSELKFQSQIIDDVKRFNKKSYAIKMNNRFISGIPDLLIKVPDYDVLFVEAKLAKVSRNNCITIGTTPIQRATMRMMERAGFTVAVWTLVDAKEELVIVCSKWDATTVELNEYNVVRRKRGCPWPIKTLLTYPMGTSHLDKPIEAC